ncbi:MAG: TonB-dependent receptor [Pseudomonas sp.]
MRTQPILLSSCIVAALYGHASSAAAQTAAGDAAASPTATDLDAVTVTAYRRSLQKSLQAKRSAGAIVDVISAEDIGKFPDTNAAESLSHLPGITIDHVYGEGEKVSINGTDPALNRVLLNGQTVASSDWGSNSTSDSGRTFNYSLLSPEIIGQMEVYKSPEARIDEGSIGGTVILHTLKPLDLPANTLRGSLGYDYNDRSERGSPRGSVMWSWHDADSNIGVLVSATHDKQYLSRAGVNFFNYTHTGAEITSDPVVSGDGDYTTARLPYGINSSYFQQTRERNGLQAALQFRPNDRNEINLTGLYIKGRYNYYSQSTYACLACDLGNISALTVHDGYITSATVEDGTAQMDTNYIKSTVTTKSLNLRHDYTGDVWNFASQVGKTSARGGKDPEYLMKFLLRSGGYTYTSNGVNFTNLVYDDASISNWGLDADTQAGGIDTDILKDGEHYAQFDADRAIAWGPFDKLLIGAKYTNHTNSRTRIGNAIYTTDAITLSEFDPGSSPDGLFDGLNAYGNIASRPIASLADVIAYLESQPGTAMQFDPSNSFSINEITAAVYAQADFETAGGWRGNLGVRYVDTQDTSHYWQSNDGGDSYEAATTRNRYRKPLPSFNLIRELGEDVILRMSAAKVIARPRFSQLGGSVSVDDTSLSGSMGNPNLRPYESTNYDLSGEWYFSQEGLLGLELFHRDISTYIITTSVEKQYTNPSTGVSGVYTFTLPENAADAKVDGASLAYQQSYGLGFGLQANYTYARANTSNGYNMPYLSRDSVNFIPYWEHGRWSVRINYTWRSKYFTTIGTVNSKIFTDDYAELGLAVNYQFNDHIGLSLDASNLLDSTYYSYNDVKQQPLSIYKSGRSAALNLNVKF